MYLSGAVLAGCWRGVGRVLEADKCIHSEYKYHAAYCLLSVVRECNSFPLDYACSMWNLRKILVA